ncbi:MAG: hypothetical protein R3E83_18205 [Burkholderiaceae bacterium]
MSCPALTRPFRDPRPLAALMLLVILAASGHSLSRPTRRYSDLPRSIASALASGCAGHAAIL